jgi:N-carbamoyl-L-amino-acid hydrolase
MTQPATFEQLWSAIADIGRDPVTGGYRRFAWTQADSKMREWFAGECASRGLDLSEDRMGNQWAWWGDPDSSADGGVVTGSHLDSVPDGGAFDGPLGVVSALLAIDRLRSDGFRPRRPIGVVNFVDEEGARFGVSCAGSRVITGVLSPDRALALRDADGVTMAEAMRAAGRQPERLGPDPECWIGRSSSLTPSEGRGLIDGRAVAVGSGPGHMVDGESKSPAGKSRRHYQAGRRRTR